MSASALSNMTESEKRLLALADMTTEQLRMAVSLTNRDAERMSRVDLMLVLHENWRSRNGQAPHVD